MVLDLAALPAHFGSISGVYSCGTVAWVGPASVKVAGLKPGGRVGDSLVVEGVRPVAAEIVSLGDGVATAMVHGATDGLAVGDTVRRDGTAALRPALGWLGRVVDAFGRPLDGHALPRGSEVVPLRAAPPPATGRRGWGTRLATGQLAFDTLLPVVRGQRLGLFAGSGVGKTTLLGRFARQLEAEVVVVGLIGERGREVGSFVNEVLDAEARSRAVVVAATSDRPSLEKRRAAWTAMAVAEWFRDQGRHVLLLIDSLTRFAEAHRDVAVTAGEPVGPTGWPASTGQSLAALLERAGPGAGRQGDITAVLSVLVAGSDQEEPLADLVRGLIDGHVVLSRGIAERGRFPAIDVRRSVSRSLPGAASPQENVMISAARKLIAAHEDAEPMLQAGLYSAGSDPVVDQAVAVWPALDAAISQDGLASPSASFASLSRALQARGSQG